MEIEDVSWRISTRGKEYSSNTVYSSSVWHFLHKDIKLFHWIYIVFQKAIFLLRFLACVMILKLEQLLRIFKQISMSQKQ